MLIDQQKKSKIEEENRENKVERLFTLEGGKLPEEMVRA
jgi:hypothetical protein